MPLVKSAAQINLELRATMHTPPPERPDCPQKQLGPLQEAMLNHICTRPYWVVNRLFWNDMAQKLRTKPYQVRSVYQSLEKGGYIQTSERDNPRIVHASDRGRR